MMIHVLKQERVQECYCGLTYQKVSLGGGGIEGYDYFPERLEEAKQQGGQTIVPGITAYYLHCQPPQFSYLPVEMDLEKYTPGEFFNRGNGVHMVSAKFRDIIEAIEPGMHYFWPARMELNGEVLEDYYHMVIGRQIEFDGFDFNVYGHYPESKVLGDLIGQKPELADILSQFPLWSIVGEETSILANDPVIERVKQANIPGLWDDSFVPDDPDDYFPADWGIQDAY